MKARRCTVIAFLGLLGAFSLGCEAGSSSSDGAAGAAESEGVCSAVADWSAEHAAIEALVVVEVNLRRAEGADCNTGGVFEPADPLTMNSQLQCAARLHSLDMLNRNFFDHVNPDEEEPWDRITETGYQWGTAGENIAAGQQSAKEVVAGWMASDGHCSNIMGPDFTEIGVGFVQGGDFGTLWTQVFASPF